MIRVEALGKSFDNKKVLSDIDITFEAGKVNLIIGKSGSGKTVLLKSLIGLHSVTTGHIYYGDRDLTTMNSKQLKSLREEIGVVFQGGALFDSQTVLENVMFPLNLFSDLSYEEKRERALFCLHRVELNKAEDLYPSEISGGMKKRVAIARALVNQPKVLLLDEPLGALDLKLRKDMQNELKRIQQQMGITFIYVTHDQEEALTMSDTVVVMDKGRIQQIGTPEDIYNEPKNAFVADFIGESNILNGTMVRDRVVKMYGKEFPCVDGGFAENEPVDVVIRPEDIDIVPVEQGQLVGTVTNVTFKGMQYDIIVDFRGFKWLIQTTDHSPVGARIGVKIDPEGFHIMKKSEYSGMFGDYSSYSEEYEELADAGAEPEEEESEDED